MKNPALRKEKRYEPAPVIPLKQEGSILEWLESNNKIMYREEKEEKVNILPVSEDEEISELIEDDDDDDDDYEEQDSDVDDDLL
ncbi:protein of unknown function DUF3134 [Cyanobacterium sp. HL-69]|uniref:DUF3134 domain-containing protein n=1 Tax=unclassified Cyanobacterium TaxID=2629879 RepID=UPI0008525B92|nr:DUF3134 domain-containing protein [Cyanobacterium sp. IPPAS B-1200]AUC61882.1 protein of unknown function DUF3134 [Cyanobacterium sp. HL-69]OEJ80130.1 hypothetical protein A5482_07495 [Cyanobacterium sp. IPPAS B-1200]